MFHDTVTLFSRFGPPRAEAFQSAVLHGVYLATARGANEGVPLQKSAHRAVLLIPFCAAEQYVTPAVWNTLNAAERAGHWTLQLGDVFLRGEVTDPTCSPSALLRSHEAFLISTVLERGSGSMAHFEVGGGYTAHRNGGLS